MYADFTKSKKIIVMLGVMSAMLLSALDQTIVATAMPRIVQELQGLEHLSWVFTAYMLTATVTVPIYGKLSDMYGRKLFYIGGILIFLLGSILSGFSQNMTQLILFRALQGIGGGAIMTNSLAIIGDLFSPAERGRWQGLLGSVFGLASVVGPTLGGWLTDNASWRWNFYINIPVGIVALCLIGFLMPKVVPHIKKKSIDFLGAILFSIALVTLLLGFVWGGTEYAWNSTQIITLFVTSALSFVLFGIVEHKAEEPILPLSLFKSNIFSISALILFLLGIGMFGAILYIPFFAQSVIGVSATNSGVILTPLMLGLILASVASGQIISRTGRYKFLTILGVAIITIAMYLLSRMSVNTTQSELVIRMIITGVGLGITMPIFTIAVQNAFDYSKLGVVTASTQLFRSVGGTVGVAIMGSILNISLSDKLHNLAANPHMQSLSQSFPQFNVANLDINKLQGLFTSNTQDLIRQKLSQLPPMLQTQAMQTLQTFMQQMKGIMADSIASIFFIGMLLMGVAFVASLFLKEIPLRKSHKERPVLEQAGVELAMEGGEFNPKEQIPLTKK